jgi:hypothetical protein
MLLVLLRVMVRLRRRPVSLRRLLLLVGLLWVGLLRLRRVLRRLLAWSGTSSAAGIGLGRRMALPWPPTIRGTL